MREIMLINSKPIDSIPTLTLNEITLLPLRKALMERHIDPDCPTDSIQALICTSKHSIAALGAEIDKYPSMRSFLNIPAFAIGAGSAHALEERGFVVEFMGENRSGMDFSKEIVPLLQGRPSLYLRAQKIISRLDEMLLDANIPLKQVIAYTNTPKTLPQSMKPPSRSILIFTAPSNYMAFVQNFGWDGSYIAIAIGLSTFYAFAPEVVGFVSPTQSIEGCIAFAKEIQQSNH